MMKKQRSKIGAAALLCALAILLVACQMPLR
jgi:hypothetical protein